MEITEVGAFRALKRIGAASRVRTKSSARPCLPSAILAAKWRAPVTARSMYGGWAISRSQPRSSSSQTSPRTCSPSVSEGSRSQLTAWKPTRVRASRMRPENSQATRALGWRSGTAQGSLSNGSQEGMGSPLPYTASQYFGARCTGLCFPQNEAGWQTRLPTPLDIRTGRLRSQHKNRKRTRFARPRRNQQTEQTQCSAWARRRKQSNLLMIHARRSFSNNCWVRSATLTITYFPTLCDGI
ncbi:hypothetical protein FQZ97_975190 [compost metagenome]